MFRILYIFGIVFLAFGLLYILFGIVGWNAALNTEKERMIPFYLGGTFVSAALFLFVQSYRLYTKQQSKLHKALKQFLRYHPSLTPEEFSHAASIPLAEAHEFLEQSSTQEQLHNSYQRNVLVRSFAKHTLN